jgi:hypothetical protein
MKAADACANPQRYLLSGKGKWTFRKDIKYEFYEKVTD